MNGVGMRGLNRGLRGNFKSQKGPRIRVFHEISDKKIFFDCGSRSTLDQKNVCLVNFHGPGSVLTRQKCVFRVSRIKLALESHFLKI